MGEFTVKFTAYGKLIEESFRGRSNATRYADDMDTLYDDVRVRESATDRVVYEPSLWDDNGQPLWCGDDDCQHCQGHSRGPPQASPCPKLEGVYD